MYMKNSSLNTSLQTIKAIGCRLMFLGATEVTQFLVLKAYFFK